MRDFAPPCNRRRRTSLAITRESRQSKIYLSGSLPAARSPTYDFPLIPAFGGSTSLTTLSSSKGGIFNLTVSPKGEETSEVPPPLAESIVFGMQS
jgi:hypothetical protein